MTIFRASQWHIYVPSLVITNEEEMLSFAYIHVGTHSFSTLFIFASLVPRNYDPTLHPLEVPREYTRALNSTKLERVFAKPFVGSLDGHGDGVHTLCKHPTQLSVLLSGACDGVVKIWNLATLKCVRTLPAAHDGFVRGLCMNPAGSMFFSCGNDKLVRHWRFDVEDTQTAVEPVQTIVWMRL